MIIAHGTLETPEFQRQNREFAAATKSGGKPTEFIVLDGYNHFEVAESLGNPYISWTCDLAPDGTCQLALNDVIASRTLT